MIDVSKCEYEECFVNDELGGVVYYFTYPVDLDEADFCKDDYGDAVMMCLSLTYENGDFRLDMSPTVEDEGELLDVDWKELHEGVNYNLHTLVGLMQKVLEALRGEYEYAYLKQSAC